MKRLDRIKLVFTRNWKLPGKERLSAWLKPSRMLQSEIKNGITWLDNEDIAIFTSADSYIEWSILSIGTYEDEINKLIRISLKEGDAALDIGANIGLQSIRMAQSVGNTGKVLAFEPLTYLQARLKKNLELNVIKNVTVLPIALADTNFEREFTVNENAWNQGTFNLGTTNNGSKKQIVTAKTGDSLLEIQQLEILKLIKIDVEGFEFQVLKGLEMTIKKHKPRIIFEYDDNYWQINNQDIKECCSFLKSMGYTLFQITAVGCELIDKAESIHGGNLFCLQLS